MHRYSQDEKVCFIFYVLFSSPTFSSFYVSRRVLDHQQGFAWRSTSWVSFNRMTSKRGQSADELQTKPREGLCGTSHTTFTNSPQDAWVTEQCSGENHKRRRLTWVPFIFHSPPLLVRFLLPLPIITQSSSHETEPAEHVPQIRQLSWPSLA